MLVGFDHQVRRVGRAVARLQVAIVNAGVEDLFADAEFVRFLDAGGAAAAAM